MLKGRVLLLSKYEKELLALVSVVAKWRPYLLGHNFTVETNQPALKHLIEQKVATETQQKWISKLMGNDSKIKYKKGKENKIVDALSWKHGEDAITLALISFPTLFWIEE